LLPAAQTVAVAMTFFFLVKNEIKEAGPKNAGTGKIGEYRK
jgi:hypothetical protein